MQIAAGEPNGLGDGGSLIKMQFRGSGDIDNLIVRNRQINHFGREWYNVKGESNL